MFIYICMYISAFVAQNARSQSCLYVDNVEAFCSQNEVERLTVNTYLELGKSVGESEIIPTKTPTSAKAEFERNLASSTSLGVGSSLSCNFLRAFIGASSFS